MAETGENAGEIQTHVETFNGFTALMKWGTVAVFLIAAFVVFLIAR
ncbi:aa3-type cytochrome c oxidase subunit IV [Sphingomonas sp. R1]|nr:aa3-type cytochrome c oxidase subunit IV [Sphingomonas sp. R1]UYY76631.1 aa3-type cytochrome c oxidase subunit IV [Sphingomonas sp. R1]